MEEVIRERMEEWLEMEEERRHAMWEEWRDRWEQQYWDRGQ